MTPIEAHVEVGRTLDLGDVLRARAVTVRGRVLDASGGPVQARFTLGRFDADHGRLGFDWQVGYFSKGDGGLELIGLRPDRYVLRTMGTDEVSSPGNPDAETQWVSGCIELSTVAGSIDDLEIRLVRPAQITLLGSEELEEGCSFRLIEAHGYTLRHTPHYKGWVPQWRVPPGTYTLVLVDADGKDLASREISVVEGVNEIEIPR
jgi:hypothetical protein